jgi:hypothetical protein
MTKEISRMQRGIDGLPRYRGRIGGIIVEYMMALLIFQWYGSISIEN